MALGVEAANQAAQIALSPWTAWWSQEVLFARFEAVFHVGASLDLVLVWLVEVGKLAGKDIIREMNEWRDNRIATLGEGRPDATARLKSNVESRKRKALGRIASFGSWAKWICGAAATLGVTFLVCTGFDHEAAASRERMAFYVALVLAPMPLSLLVIWLVGRRQLRKLKSQNREQEEGMALIPQREDRALANANEEIARLTRELEAERQGRRAPAEATS